MKLLRLSFLFIVASLLVILISCSNQDSASEKSATEQKDETINHTDDVEYIDELNIAITAQPPTLDPSMTVSQVALNAASNIFETLYSLNETYEPVPMLAKSVNISNDGKKYTFELREGIMFHNGKEMTSEDVVASMNRWLETSSRAKSLLTDATFEAEDKYTVVLNLEQATSDVLIIMATKAQFPAIMPVEIVETADAEGVHEYIGTGPFKLEEWKQDQYIHLVKYDDYKPIDIEASGLAGKKEALVDHVYYHFVTDHATRISGLQAGQYDIADSIPLENYELINDDENIEVYAYDGGALTAFYNTNEGILAKEDIRKAITTGLDMEAILIASFVHDNLYTLDPGYMNPAQEQWRTDAGIDTYNLGDIEKAKQLLNEAGYNGEKVTLLTTKDYGEMYAATLVIQEQLRKMDVNVDVEVYDFPTFMDRKEDYNNWDIFVASTGYQLTPPQILAVTPDWAGFEHPKAAELLLEIRSAATAEEAKMKWDELQQFLYEHLPSTVLGHYKSLVASTNKVEGFTVFEAPIVWNTKVMK